MSKLTGAVSICVDVFPRKPDYDVAPFDKKNAASGLGSHDKAGQRIKDV